MAETLSDVFWGGVWSSIHNARFLGIEDAERGSAACFDVDGERLEIPTDSAECPLGITSKQPGEIGFLARSPMEQVVRYHSYLDQSLRRVPALDRSEGRLVVGWRCDSRPEGFWAPLGLTPGANGGFVNRPPIPVTLDVPEEFERLAQEYNLSMLDLLRGFIGDVCGLENFVSNPRSDGYYSHGSDERMLAQDWLERAYGLQRIEDFAAKEEQEWEADAAREELASALDVFIDAGGTAEELLAAVDAIVAAKQSAT